MGHRRGVSGSEGVSPVIATVLMVSLTVVMASVVWAMVADFGGDSGLDDLYDHIQSDKDEIFFNQRLDAFDPIYHLTFNEPGTEPYTTHGDVISEPGPNGLCVRFPGEGYLLVDGDDVPSVSSDGGTIVACVLMEEGCNQYGGIVHKGVERSGYKFTDEVFTMQLFEYRPAFGVMDTYGNYGIDPALCSERLEYDTWYLLMGYWTEDEVGICVYDIETGDLLDSATASLDIPSGGTVVVEDNDSGLVIGAQTPESGGYYSFKGGIDELMIFGDALSQSEMASLAAVLSEAYAS